MRSLGASFDDCPDVEPVNHGARSSERELVFVKSRRWERTNFSGATAQRVQPLGRKVRRLGPAIAVWCSPDVATDSGNVRRGPKAMVNEFRSQRLEEEENLQQRESVY